MTTTDANLLRALEALLEAMAREVDLEYEQADLVNWAVHDDDGLTFRKTLNIVRQAGGTVGEVATFLEGRCQRAYREFKDAELPPVQLN